MTQYTPPKGLQTAPCSLYHQLLSQALGPWALKGYTLEEMDDTALIIRHQHPGEAEPHVVARLGGQNPTLRTLQAECQKHHVMYHDPMAETPNQMVLGPFRVPAGGREGAGV